MYTYLFLVLSFSAVQPAIGLLFLLDATVNFLKTEVIMSLNDVLEIRINQSGNKNKDTCIVLGITLYRIVLEDKFGKNSANHHKE